MSSSATRNSGIEENAMIVVGLIIGFFLIKILLILAILDIIFIFSLIFAVVAAFLIAVSAIISALGITANSLPILFVISPFVMLSIGLYFLYAHDWITKQITKIKIIFESKSKVSDPLPASQKHWMRRRRYNS
jgi:hypothetical protein